MGLTREELSDIFGFTSRKRKPLPANPQLFYRVAKALEAEFANNKISVDMDYQMIRVMGNLTQVHEIIVKRIA